jgi:hypothetical protein
MNMRLEYRVYEWRLESARQEIEQDFSLLRRIKNISLSEKIEYLDLLSDREKLELLDVLIRKGTDTQTLKEVNKELNEADEAQFSRYVNFLQQKTYSVYLKGLSLTKSGLQNDLTPRILRQARGIPDIPKATFSRLKNKVVKPLISILGEPTIKENYGLTYITQISKGIFLDTHVTRGGYAQITLMQSIITGEPNCTPRVDIASRIGLGFTEWDMLTNGDYDEFREIVITLVNYILKSLSVFFDR